MQKKIIIALLIAAVSILFTLLQTKENRIKKDVQLYNVSPYIENLHFTDFEHTKTTFPETFQVEVDIVRSKSLLKGVSFNGVITINDKQQYDVSLINKFGDNFHLAAYDLTKQHEAYGLLSADESDKPIPYSFSIIENSLFEHIVLLNYEENGKSYILAGPANSYEEALEKIKLLLPAAPL